MHVGPILPEFWPTALAILVACFLFAWAWWTAQAIPDSEWPDGEEDEIDGEA